MKAVFRRELKRLFGGFTGWAIVAIVLGSFTVAAIAALRSGGSVNPAALVRQASWALALIGAVCAGSGFDRERREGTDRLLRSLPLSASALTMGKYLALCVPFLCGCAAACLHGLFLAVFAKCAVGPYYAALLLYACAGLGAIALGLWVSGWTRFALVNALIAAAVFALMFYSGRLAALALAGRFGSPAAMIAIALALLALAFAATRDFGWALVVALIGEVAAMLLLNGNAAAVSSFWNGAAALLGGFEYFDAPAQGVLDLGGIVYFALMAAVCLTLAALGWRMGALRGRRSAE